MSKYAVWDSINDYTSFHDSLEEAETEIKEVKEEYKNSNKEVKIKLYELIDII